MDVGYATVVYKHLYPDAKVVCVEPDKENAMMLFLNTRQFSSIHLENKGLWWRAANVEVSPTVSLYFARVYCFYILFLPQSVPICLGAMSQEPCKSSIIIQSCNVAVTVLDRIAAYRGTCLFCCPIEGGDAMSKRISCQRLEGRRGAQEGCLTSWIKLVAIITSSSIMCLLQCAATISDNCIMEKL